MHPLDGPRAKIGRASGQITTLRQSAQRFFRDNLYEIGVAEYNSKANNYSLRVKSGPQEFPIDWSLLIGEIAHNLRSALDGLIYQLIRANGKWPSSNSQFPIFLVGKTKRHRTGKAKRSLIPHFWGKELADGLNMIGGVADRHLAMIERFQPYKRGNGGRKCALFLLKKLNNTDKHRLLAILAPTADSLSFSGMAGHVHFNRRVTLYTNAKIGWVTDVPPNRPGQGAIYTFDPTTGKLSEPKMEVKVDVAPGIRFGDSCQAVKGFPVIRTVDSMANQVSRIIESFSHEFPK
jgi:hypothetical protein